MNFKKAGLFIGASTLVRLLGGVVTVKLIAVSIGPSGLGQLGQFMSMMAICVLLAAGGIQNGVVTGLAQREESSPERESLWRTARTAGAVASAVAALVLLIAADPLSVFLFRDTGFVGVVRLFALLQFALCFSTLAAGRVIAEKQTLTFAWVSSSSVVIGLLGLSLAAWNFGVKGAAYGLVWSAACPAIVYGIRWLRQRQSEGNGWGIHPPDLSYLAKFSLMVVVSAIAMPTVQILLREHILARGSWDDVGSWQAVLRFSDASLQFVGVLLSSHFLPRISAVRDRAGLQQHVMEAYRFLLPVIAAITAFAYFFSAELVRLLFSREFGLAITFLPWQCLGDALRGLSLVLGFVALSRGNLTLYISAEVFQGVSMLVGGWLLVDRFGPIGVTYAYILTYGLYLPICVAVYLTYLRRLPPSSS
ncbi:O-antigen translocase [Roseateles sp.]|uniref:O-antigen translocase n=1 Tax=Roseateles sp. TaxID=1971397 RepID=UPI002F401CBF